ncbi:MAG: hypothetical protein ACOZFS_03770 [Thermodesulfobacteriota bacterium]
MEIGQIKAVSSGSTVTRSERRPVLSVLIPFLVTMVILISGFKDNVRASETALIEEINVQKLVNGFNNNIIKQGNVVYDSKRNKVYVSGGLTQSTFAIINPDTDTVENIFDIGMPGGTMALSDSGMLYILNGHLPAYVKYNPDTKTAENLQNPFECQQAMDSKKYGIGRQRSWNGYALVGESTWDAQRYRGFSPTSTQNLNGLYNKIKLIHNHSEKGVIIHGPDSMFFDLDAKHGKIYASNTGDGSISVFDLKKLNNTNYCKANSCWVKDIDFGTSIDEILLDSSGNIYIRNRLGGSTIYRYNQSTKRISLFADNENNLSKKQAIWNSNNWKGGGISMWPTGFSLSRDGKEMYVLSHYNAAIDVIEVATGNYLTKIIFPVPWKPRTDSLSEITMDYSNNRMFAVWPELGLIGVADLTNRQVIGTIDLSPFGFDKSRSLNRGLRLVKLAYNSKGDKLYIFLTDEKKLIRLNGKTFQIEREAIIPGGLDQFNSILLSNDDKNEIYLGNHIIDSVNFTEKNHLTPHSLIIVGFNNHDNSVYADQILPDQTKGRLRNVLYKFVPGQAPRQLSTGANAVIPGKYYFDFPRNTLYVYFMAEAKIRKYDLRKMQ